MNENLKKIAVYYGLDNQIDKLVEEVCELIVAILHHQARGFDKSTITEEIADVEILLGQICILLDFEIDISNVELREFNQDSIFKSLFDLAWTAIEFKSTKFLRDHLSVKVTHAMLALNDIKHKFLISELNIDTFISEKIERQLVRMVK